MFQRIVHFSENSSLEVASRVFNNEDQLILTMTGRKNSQEVTSSSIILNDEHLEILLGFLNDASVRDKAWPPVEQEVK